MLLYGYRSPIGINISPLSAIISFSYISATSTRRVASPPKGRFAHRMHCVTTPSHYCTVSPSFLTPSFSRCFALEFAIIAYIIRLASRLFLRAAAFLQDISFSRCHDHYAIIFHDTACAQISSPSRPPTTLAQFAMLLADFASHGAASTHDRFAFFAARR